MQELVFAAGPAIEPPVTKVINSKTSSNVPDSPSEEDRTKPVHVKLEAFTRDDLLKTDPVAADIFYQSVEGELEYSSAEYTELVDGSDEPSLLDLLELEAFSLAQHTRAPTDCSASSTGSSASSSSIRCKESTPTTKQNSLSRGAFRSIHNALAPAIFSVNEDTLKNFRTCSGPSWNSIQHLKEHLRNVHTKQVKKFNPLDSPNGYPRMATRLLIDTDHDTALCRRSSILHARALPNKDAELAELEAQLVKIDQEDEDKSGADTSSLRKNQTISRPRYRRGRGPRQKIGLNGSDDPNDPDFFNRDIEIRSQGGSTLLARSRLDSQCQLPFLMSEHWVTENGKLSEISKDFKDPGMQSVSGHKIQIDGILRNVVFNLRGSTVTYRRDVYICKQLNEWADMVIGAKFMAEQFAILFSKAKNMFAGIFSYKKETAEEKGKGRELKEGADLEAEELALEQRTKKAEETKKREKARKKREEEERRRQHRDQ